MVCSLFRALGMAAWSGRYAAQYAFQLHFLENLVLNGLGQAVDLIYAPTDADLHSHRALAGGHFGKGQVGVDHQLRIRGAVARQHLGELRAHGGWHAGQCAIGGKHIAKRGRLARCQQAGAEGAGLDDGDVHTKGRHLIAQGLRIAFQRVFGSGVGAEKGRRDATDKRTGVDDQAGSRLTHRGQNRLHGPDNAVIVGVHLLVGLIDAIPNLVATKNTGGGLDRAASLMTHAPELQHFFGEANFPHGCLYGECALLSSFGPMSPHKAKALFEAGRRGDLPTMFALQKEFHDMLHGLLGPLLAEGRIDGAYDKLLVRLGRLEEMPLRLLSPYQGFSEEQYQTCKRILHEQFPAFLP